MDEIIKKCKRYCYDILGADINMYKLESLNQYQLPYVLVENYDFYDFFMLQRELIAVHPIREMELTPVSYKKQIEIIKRQTNKKVILILDSVDSFNRKRLIDQKIQFIVPGKQMYIPYLGMDLREHFSNIHIKKNKFRPATQSILLYLLLDKNHYEIDVDKLSLITNYSKSSIRRAFLEFEDAKIGKLTKVGKNKIFCLDNNFDSLWKNAKKRCTSPVKQEIFLSEKPKGSSIKTAGISALAEYTMIAPPRNEEYATYKNEWYELIKDNSVKKLIEPRQTEYNIKLQIWSYPPDLWKNLEIVDRYSLYLSLKGSNDERVEQALIKMLNENNNRGL